MHKLKFLTISIIMLLLFSAASPSTGISERPLAQTAPTLGVVGSYSVLAAVDVTNTGATSMNGDLGISGGNAPTGGPVVGGAIRTQADAITAQTQATNIVNALTAQGPGTTTASNELGGLNLTQGVYTVNTAPGASLLNGTLTINGPGVFIFLTSGFTSFGGTVSLIGGADPCNIFWYDTSQYTMNAGSNIVGTIIASSSVVFGAGTNLDGRVIAQTASVTLNNTTITGPTCAVATGGEEEDNSVSGLPNTGGAPIQNGDFPWSLAILGGISAIALGLGLRAYRRNQLQK